MNPEDKPTHYEVLEITPDASQSQIREAYLRVKATYGKDSVALYTLIDPHEREVMLHQIEEAYLTLSDIEKRKDYDTCHGLLDAVEPQNSPFSSPPPARVVSIDRTPPMSSSPEDLLVPPITAYDRGSTSTAFGRAEDAIPRHDLMSNRDLSHADDPFSPLSGPSAPAPEPFEAAPTQPQAQYANIPPSAAEAELFKPEPPAPAPVPARPDSKFPDLPGDLATEIETQAEWAGALLKRVRESRRISIEEMANITKVSKTYLFAIEDENFAKLPAPVFVRGFVNQVARTLKLPANDVVNAYMNRFNRHRPESKK